MACKDDNQITFSSENEGTKDTIKSSRIDANVDETSIHTLIYVHIGGQVKKPGVYHVSEGTRLFQLIELAGGTKKNAYQKGINLAETVVDGQSIYIPSKSEYKVSNSESDLKNTELETSNKLNINTATEEELTSLPGIGESKAITIISYREENGDFKSIEDIKNVSGIGNATFANIKDLIRIN